MRIEWHPKTLPRCMYVAVESDRNLMTRHRLLIEWLYLIFCSGDARGVWGSVV